MTCLLAVLLVPVVAADEPPGFAERVERVGKLPAELVKAKKADGDIIDAIYLGTLSRLPTEKEKQVGAKFLAAAGASEKARTAAARDFAWVVVNTKEFLKLYGLDDAADGTFKLLSALRAKWPNPATEKN
jgi:hypothetical protein